MRKITTFLLLGLFCPPYQYKPKNDRFNAAQSGMMASNLTIELNYLLEQLYKEPIEVVLKSYKYLTLFIGSNDICFRCSNDLPWLTSEQFEDYLKSTLLRLSTGKVDKSKSNSWYITANESLLREA